MRFYLTAHARERMEERSIGIRIIEDALTHPTRISKNRDNTTIIKKFYKKSGKRRLLLIVGYSKKRC